MTDVVKADYLYGTYTGENADGYVKTRVVPFRIVKKTPKRIFYVADWIHGTTDRLGSVNRQELESTGEVYNRARGWWDADFHLRAEPPQLATGRVDPAALKAELGRLRAEAAAAHPDRGGSHEAFIEAHKRYADARRQFGRLLDRQEEP